MFPYSHMTREELLTRAELEGDGLSRALAKALDESEEEREAAENESNDKEKQDAAYDDGYDAGTLALRDKERAIERAFDLIPRNTKHKGLLAIKAALEQA